MTVLISNRQKRHKIKQEKIRKTAQDILDALGYPDAELSVLIVDDTGIAELNKEYLKRWGPTNVIAFPMMEGVGSDVAGSLLGDVVISMETAWKEAMLGEMDFGKRFDELLIHGILHLVGFDHEKNREDALIMEKKAEEILALIRPEEEE